VLFFALFPFISIIYADSVVFFSPVDGNTYGIPYGQTTMSIDVCWDFSSTSNKTVLSYILKAEGVTHEDVTSCYTVQNVTSGSKRWELWVEYSDDSYGIYYVSFNVVPMVSLTIDNNFIDNSSSGTRGTVIIDESSITVPSSGYSFTKAIGQSIALQAVTPQTDNESYQRIWYTDSYSPSNWSRNTEVKSYNQSYSFPVIADDDGKTYLANYRQVKTTTSGTLSSNENWFTNVTLTNNVTVPPGITLNLTSDATVNLNGYSILSTGGTITNNATVTGLKALLKSSGVIKGIYPTIESALNAASSGNVVEVKNSNSLSGNVTVPSGVTLTITSSASITLGSYSITTTSGTISVQSGATVNPYIPLKQSSAIKGLYPTVQTAVNAASSGSTVELQNTTYSGSVSFSSKSGITLSGAGSSVISSGISLTNSSSISISGMRMSNGPSINGGSSNTFINSTVTGSTVTSNYNASETSIYYITAENIEASFGVNSYNGSGTMIYSDIQNGDCAVYLTNSADWDIRTGNEFCGNGYDVYAVSPAYAYVTDNTSYSSSSPVYGNVDLEQTPIPVCSMSKAIAVKENETESQFSPLLKELDKKYINLLREINKGRENEKFDLRNYKNETEELIKEYKKFLSNDNTTETIDAAISKIGYLYKGQENNKGFYDFIESTIASGNLKTMYPYLKRHLIWKAVDENDYESSLKIANEVLSVSDISENLKAEMLYEKGLVYKYYLSDITKAEAAFNEIINKYPENDMIHFANMELGKSGGTSKDRKSVEQETNSSASLAFESSSYPNPFNPTTTISYTLPSDGRVTIKVFDMLGREVKTLVNDYKNAGGYSTIWDSKDSFGNEVSSGIYFYNIKFMDNSITKKMVLVR